VASKRSAAKAVRPPARGTVGSDAMVGEATLFLPPFIRIHLPLAQRDAVGHGSVAIDGGHGKEVTSSDISPPPLVPLEGGRTSSMVTPISRQPRTSAFTHSVWRRPATRGFLVRLSTRSPRSILYANSTLRARLRVSPGRGDTASRLPQRGRALHGRYLAVVRTRRGA
jgi:hypothetical protein